MELSILEIGGVWQGSFGTMGAFVGIILLIIGLCVKTGSKGFVAIGLIGSILAIILLPVFSSITERGFAVTKLSEGTFLVENASSTSDGNIHVVIRARNDVDDANSTITRYVILKNTEVENFPAEPILAGNFKLTVRDVSGSGQTWRTYTFAEK